jgi:hypothetical protein
MSQSCENRSQFAIGPAFRNTHKDDLNINMALRSGSDVPARQEIPPSPQKTIRPLPIQALNAELFE